MTVSLTNLSRRPFRVTLYCECYLKGGFPCAGNMQRVPRVGQTDSGVTGLSYEERCVPKSLRIEPRQTVDGLPDEVLHIPQVHAAEKTQPRTLRAVRTPTRRPAAVAPKPSPSGDSTDKPSAEPRSKRPSKRKGSSPSS